MSADYSQTTPPPIPPSASPSGTSAGKWRRYGRNILLGLAVIVSIGLAGAGKAFWDRTLVSWWLPALFALVLSLPLLPPGLRLWRFLTGSRKRWISITLHILSATAVFYFLILYLNYRGADFSKAYEAEATVERKYMQEHTSSSGGRRHHNVRKYNTWHYTMRLPDGRVKQVQVSLSDYNRLRSGSRVAVEIADGSFGMQVYRPED